VSSAANTVTPETDAQNATNPAGRPDPVPLDVGVAITGTRAEADGGRQLFSEETKTVLVFRDGAVVRLAAPVSLGQLIFLTNKNSSVEVVCQVVQTRAAAGAAPYVELKFTEEKPDFWGVEFPATGTTAPELHKLEHVEAATLAQREPASNVAPHKEEVDQLKKEVETLRKHLLGAKPGAAAAAPPGAESRSSLTNENDRNETISSGAKAQVLPGPNVGAEACLRRQAPTPSAPVREIASGPAQGGQTAPPSGPTAAATKTNEVGASSGGQQPSVAQPVQPAQVQAQAPLMPTASESDKQEPARAFVGMALPLSKGPAHDPDEDLLPKPELDFSKIPGAGQGTLGQPGTPAKASLRPPRTVALRKVAAPALAVLGLVLAVAAWVEKPWTYFGIGRKPVATVAVKNTKPVAPLAKAVGAPASAPVPVAKAQPAAPKPVEVKPAADVPAASAVAPAPAVEKERATSEAETRGEEPVAAQPAVAKPRATKARNESAAGGGVSGDAGAHENAVNDTPVLPAKLVKPVNPVYPPDAMVNFITGDVRAEVEVKPDGHVGDVKVLSGPKPLRDAAVDALRQYQYEPATQGGKAVASKVTVTVKFWFNP